MDHREYAQMYEKESHYWWHLGRSHMVKEMLKKYVRKEKINILDIGCGTGIVMQDLQNFGKVIGLDMAEEALRFCRKRGLNNLILGRAEKIPEDDEKHDLIVALDIIEHADDDVAVLAEFKRVLKPGGQIFITVPAYKFLWSDHDIALHHKRRYSMTDLVTKVQKAGFRIQKRSHFFFFVFPAVLIVRLFNKLKPAKDAPQTSYVDTHHLLNSFFVFLLKIETLLLKLIRLPFGSSLVLIAEKKESK